MNEDQEFEASFWRDCANTYGEETKHITIADRLCLPVSDNGGHWPSYDLGGRSVLDLGGGPVSILLKSYNLGRRCTVVDPCPYPEWVTARYEAHGIEHIRENAETFMADEPYDEVWIYNVLQHVFDVEAVLTTALESAPVLRIFEWLDTPRSPGHPHSLDKEGLRNYLLARGTGDLWTETLHENYNDGLALHGVLTVAC